MFTPQQRAEAVRRTLQGEKVKDVAKSLGCTSACVSIWRTKAKKKTIRRPRQDYAKVGRLVTRLFRELSA